MHSNPKMHYDIHLYILTQIYIRQYKNCSVCKSKYVIKTKQQQLVKVKWRVAKYDNPYSEYVLCI